MSDLRQCSHEFLSEFIELYRSFPCLWKIKSKEYSDRDKKRQAYEILIRKYKEIDHAANKETIVKKNKFIANCVKELSKVNKSIRSGAGDEDIYKPSLWYFDLLSFLNDQETPRKSTSTIDDETDARIAEQEEEPLLSGDLQSLPASQTILPSARTASKKRKGQPDSTEQLVGLATEYFKRPETEEDILAKSWAMKLKKLLPDQRRFAEKIINDTLFEAEIGTLTRDGVPFVMQPRWSSSPSSSSTQLNYNWQRYPSSSYIAQSTYSSASDSPSSNGTYPPQTNENLEDANAADYFSKFTSL
ncbi:hypothetical protein ABEB36_014432 [Hypothenemus hampei]|uniref:MADF domain-containing protein n=1 Tax=Hypothenemus hampei TaxID=57062 RepID=A0ABD1E1T7_HYPHA